MKTAESIISMMCDELGLDPIKLSAADKRRLRGALEDGAALAALGIGDEDQEAVENAHAIMK